MATPMRSEQIENWLQSENGVKFHLETMPRADIDTDKSLANQARLGHPLIPALVEDYAEAVLQGNRFPPLVGWRNGTDKLILIDGNNRLASYTKVGKPTEVDVYVVESQDASTLDRLTRTANRRINGDRPSRADAVLHAIHRVTRFGEAAVTAATDFSIPVEELNRALARQRTRVRLDQLGIPTGRLTDWILYRLSHLHSDPVMEAVAKLHLDAQLTGDQVEVLIRDVRVPRNEAAQVAVVIDWRNRPDIQRRIEAARKGSTRPPTLPGTRALQAMGTLKTLCERNTTSDLMGLTTPGDLDRFAASFKATSDVVSRWINRQRGMTNGAS